MKRSNLKDISFSYLGPDLDMGPLPCVIYFGLSDEESLLQDPYNQSATFLTQFPMRILSFNLPFHGAGYKAIDAMGLWANEMERDDFFLRSFLEKCREAVYTLLQNQILIENKLGVMGLSRGGMIASHLCNLVPEIEFLLAFAPLTDFSVLKEFQHIKENEKVLSWDLENLASTIYNRKIRFYVGNRDVTVSTKKVFNLVSNLVETAFTNKIRSPLIELFITPSIGMNGHGTSKQIFEEGALWMAKQLGIT